MGENPLLDIAIKYHEALPERIRAYLHGRGIPDAIIRRHLLGWNGERISIPIFNRDGTLLFFRLAKDPEDRTPSPKMVSPWGSRVELYGWEGIARTPDRLVICEGEFDRLVLEAHGFAAVTSTGGAGSFRPEWAEHCEGIPELFICFDRDQAGSVGAMRTALFLPHARIVELPEEVGEGGDITDFFVRLGRTAEHFEKLLEEAAPPSSADSEKPTASRQERHADSALGERIAQLKRAIPIASVIAPYVELKRSGSRWVGRCPFHEDHDPSLVVYPATDSYHCFGCGAHGDAITFLQSIEHMTFLQTLEVLERMTPPHDPTTPDHR